MGWYRERSPIFSNENAMAALLVAPIQPILPRNGLKIGDLPVSWVPPHGGELLGCGVQVVILPVKLL